MNMPGFTPRLAAVSKDRYKIKFLEDGYPGKDTGDHVVPHPIYGIYVIRDYLYQYKKTKDPAYQEAAITVADAAIGRMSSFHHCLVYWYREGTVFNSTNKDYYSGLTQAYYADMLAQMYVTTGHKRYQEAAEKVYESLRIPVEEGGVFHRSSQGPSIQEYPMAPNGYVLNGWLSALSSIKHYAELVEDEEADVFWRDNLQTITKLLPLFDAPHLANSRYTLNGMVTMKVLSSSNLELQDVCVRVPGEGEYNVFVAENKKYEHFIVQSSVLQHGQNVYLKNKSALFKVLLSRYSYPKENELTFTLYSPGKSTVQFLIVPPTYFPKNIIKEQQSRYQQIKKVPIQKGRNEITLNVPWDMLQDLGEPTRFKQFGSKWHNVYHFIHLHRLEEFYEVTKNEKLLEYITKWRSYVESWRKIPLYNGLEKEPYKSR
ncbi:D-glucuronyl C5-epimerase family protein [Salibacterium qingdaonense]|uniref:D-glucuronyl C5-epimerase C-terminus n=1 Tax=Salibacterium qingdaonense TaxID=266892 RepID=A0A1I4ME23_9BACI|nr:D-glucuronyl C5-epimerase family protein [Salibacterium qingdaonense]SFM01662.1 D-glucuronyl C5-epimerase C-terminus [Salibacterium qingdaonense]